LYKNYIKVRGHIEKGIIKFTLADKGDGKYSFTISSMSEVDMGLAPEGFARKQQKNSWLEVLDKIVKKSGGKETSRTETITLSIMPGRTYSAGKGYRYGFNGKENDNEVKKDGYGSPNIGTQQDYGMRIYDGQLGRFLSVDPLSEHYPWYTPYSFGGNSPIKFIDLDGKEEYDPTNDAFFVGKLIMTTFYDVKHSFPLVGICNPVL
jgi:RHS repeat-associated protein